MLKRITLILLATLLTVNVAEARKRSVRHTHTQAQSWEFVNPAITDGFFQGNTQPSRASRVRGVRYATNTTYIPHPAGCPRRAFCGCGLAVSIFGRPIRDLWLAANWFKFPRTTPASGMVAVRRHHVFKLVQQASSGNWIVEDYNSGGGLSRIHERSLAGYVIVNPRG